MVHFPNKNEFVDWRLDWWILLNCSMPIFSRDLDYKKDELEKQMIDCPEDKSGTKLECLKIKGIAQNFQCVAGIRSPVCCYVAHLTSNSALVSEHKNILQSVYGPGVQLDLKKCSFYQREKDIEMECPLGDNLSKEGKERYYIFNKNLSCNPLFMNTVRGCSTHRNTNPCYGRCLTGMMINIEITSVSRNNTAEHGETFITIVQTAVEFNQKASASLNKEDNSFGFLQNEKRKHITDQVQILRKRVNPLPLYAGEWNGIWLQWTYRNPVCIQSRQKESILTPVLVAGLEGSPTPVFEVDFACINFKGDEKDAFGWRFGWFGSDILLPRISAVWKPNFYAINSDLGSVFSLAHAGTKLQCYEMRAAGKMPIALIFALSIGGLFCFAIIFLCFWT